ncbi:serine palmitoyltransferase 1 [Cimex lectularius]|uniref:Serine palmitoyltransferase 1 n=1 Tax=Cimex lectularius TaxID=79782 RepID=A0A8I6RJ61_CIMLE|nr:serine palmitoyltransferase 1 [Cimex lectularius]XP_014247190.1 serine palmitoyltransferase 1 [Cimex lectularius]
MDFEFQERTRENSYLYETIFYYVPHLSIYFELILLVMVLWIMFKKSTPIDESWPSKEEEEIIEKYTPRLLVEDIDTKHRLLNRPVLTLQEGKYITIDNQICLNMATQNFLGFAKDKHIEKETIQSIEKYGVGSCGPRGFYGTVDVHLELEEKLAKFLDSEEVVVYSYGFSTIASAIPAYSKKNDIIFVDECANYPIQKGLDASRSTIHYFKHNDMEDLERLLKQEEEKTQKKKKPSRARKFLVVEGIYQKTGFMCPLDKLVELRKKYKLRLFLDESISIGTIGSTGRGLREHFGIKASEIDLIIGSLENSLGSVGGFCVGTSFIVEHQRLSGLGYCFSASLPPLLTTAAIEALQILKEKPHLVTSLQEKCKLCNELLHDCENIKKHFKINGSSLSPVKILELKDKKNKEKLDEIVQNCLTLGVAFAIPSYLPNDTYQPPAIKVVVNRLHTEADLKAGISTLDSSVRLMLSPDMLTAE